MVPELKKVICKQIWMADNRLSQLHIRMQLFAVALSLGQLYHLLIPTRIATCLALWCESAVVNALQLGAAIAADPKLSTRALVAKVINLIHTRAALVMLHCRPQARD